MHTNLSMIYTAVLVKGLNTSFAFFELVESRCCCVAPLGAADGGNEQTLGSNHIKKKKKTKWKGHQEASLVLDNSTFLQTITLKTHLCFI